MNNGVCACNALPLILCLQWTVICSSPWQAPLYPIFLIVVCPSVLSEFFFQVCLN